MSTNTAINVNTSSTDFNFIIIYFLIRQYFILFTVVLHHQYYATLEVGVRRHCFTTIVIIIDITYNKYNLKLRNGIT